MLRLKRQRANLALLISAGGLACLTATGGHGFVHGLLRAGFLAATVGGLADWFAVTALFKKPLGIAFRTDILRRNRARIQDALVDYAAHDILSAEHIVAVAQKLDLAAMLCDYLRLRGGKRKLLDLIGFLAHGVAESMDEEAIAKALAPALRDALKTFPLEKLLLDSLAIFGEKDWSDRALTLLLREAQESLHDARIQEVILDLCKGWRKAYSEGATGRDAVLAMMELSDERLASLATSWLNHQIEAMLRHEGAAYVEVKAALEMFALHLQKHVGARTALSAWKDMATNHLEIEKALERWLAVHMKGDKPFWEAPLLSFAAQKIDAFQEDKALQKRATLFLQKMLRKEVTDHHEVIVSLARKRLQEFSDDDLTQFVESRVADDLQMIRINGAVVGGTAGMALYIVSHLVLGG